MKKIIQILSVVLLTIISNTTFAQSEYPMLLKNSEGTFIVFTISQANHINNTYDLNMYLDSIITQLDEKDSIHLVMVDSTNKIISKFNVIISAQNQKIKNFQEINDNFNLILDGYRKESEMLNKNNADLIKKNKFYKSVAITSVAINVILLTLILLQ